MKRHVTASAVETGVRHEGRALAHATGWAHTAYNDTRTRPASSEPTLALASEKAWTHTLVLSGELHQRSAHALEAEIERLCEAGVTGITLDLRGLTYIDPIGVAVIAFRCGLCERRGYDFAVIPGSRFVHRALEQAGVTNLLAGSSTTTTQPIETAAR
jgi:anti-anti-sigma factor